MWQIDTTKLYKIWFSKDPSIFLGIENQLRFIRLRNYNPKATISLVYSAQCLNDQAKKQLQTFCTQYNIQTLDFDNELPNLLEDKHDKEIYELAKKEIQHPEGSLAAASDCVRTLVPLIKKLGIYSDFDVIVKFDNVASLPVKAPVVIPAVSEKNLDYINVDFIAVAHQPNNPQDLSDEGVKGIRAVQKKIIWRYNAPLLEAFSTGPIPGFNSTHVTRKDWLYAVILNYNYSYPNKNVFDLRQYIMQTQDELSVRCFDGKNIINYRFKDDNLDALKSEILRVSVVMYSGADAWYALYENCFQNEEKSLTSLQHFKAALSKSSLKTNNLLHHVQSKTSSNLLHTTLSEAAGVYRDASWTDLGIKRTVEREASIYKTASRILFNYRQKHTSNYSRYEVPTSVIHESLLREITPLIEREAKFFEPLLKSLTEKKYSQALRRAANTNHLASEKIVKILLRYKDKLNIEIIEKIGDKIHSALQYAAEKNNMVIYNLLLKSETRLQQEDRTNAHGCRIS